MLWTFLGAWGCGKTPQSPQASESSSELPAMEARVLTVAPADWPFIVRTQGSLIADEVAQIGSNVAGRVEQVHIDLGDVVQAGQPLVTLDQTDFELEVARAEAALAQSRAAVGLAPGDPVESLNVENSPPVRQERALWDEAKGQLDRALSLQAQNAIPAESVETSVAAEQAASARYSAALNSVQEKIALIRLNAAQLAIAQRQLENAVIRAPFDGLVQQRQAAPGAYVQVGQSIATLVRGNPLRFQGTMPERYSQQLALGQEVRLKVESVPDPLTVTVSRISPSLDQLSRALTFEAEVENGDGRLRTGLFAEAEVILNADAQSIVVPMSALVEFAGVERVWKVVEGKATEQTVLTGQRRPEGVEIVEGLKSGDIILVEGDAGREARIVAVAAPPVRPPDS